MILPLILLPYLVKAKTEMREILEDGINKLIDSDHLSIQIANIICDHLFMNMYGLYDKKIMENKNVKSLVLLRYIGQFGFENAIKMDIFNTFKCNDKESLEYLWKNNCSDIKRLTNLTKTQFLSNVLNK